ncbi:DUF927 domain-containing protein [Symbiopectobacterium purcellii]|uniref:DUF927 domain-containing protein n=1 Tax=Symbiopectobacterium purcellii TaxID=2871826 RepID=UPI003F86C80A
MPSFVDEVRAKANGHWEPILERLGISTNRKESECPSCGGKTRYRFDDLEGRGTYLCSHCGSGTGLDLVMKVKQCTAPEATAMVAEVMSMPLPEKQPAKEKPLRPIAERVAALVKATHRDESVYLNNKGLKGPHPLLDDGSLLLVLRTMAGTVTGAQTIRPTGEKRLLAGTKKKGAFIPVGDIPENPDNVVITEGYATGLSLVACGAEVILAAIDAGNLLSVAQVVRERWPQTPIIIAGDNDVTPEGENVGKHAAEEAARAAGCLVAVPPTDHKADWNDYRQQNGVEALQRAFVASTAVPEILIAEGGEQVEESVVSPTTLTVIEGGKKAKKTPDPLKPRIESRDEGVYWVEPKMDKDSGEIVNREQWLCSPLTVIGKGEDKKERYLILEWRKGKQKAVTRAIRAADIGEREGWRTLKAGGVDVTTKSGLRATLGDWLQRSAGEEMWRITPRSGWHKGAYIMPDGSIIGDPEQPILFNGSTAASEAYSVAGTPESWRDNVARLASGNPFQMLTVGVALAAPMLPLVGADGFGVHLYAQSTAGKTTAEDLAASLYGEPERQRLTWYGTALGVANEAEAHNHGLLSLDEVDQGAAPKHVYTAAYTLFNGKGKLQGSPEGGNREQKYWKTAVISTGERDLETYLKSAGIKVNAGQLVRLLNIPVTRPTKLHGYESGKAHADALKDAWKQHHGAAGREWIQYLSTRKQEAIEAYQEAKRRWLSLIPESYGEQVHRVTDRFAVIEAALIMGKVITGWDAQDCRDALQHVFNEWIAAFGTGNKECEQIIEQAEAFLSAYGMSRFAPLDYNEQALIIPNLAGYRVSKRYGDPVVFYVLPKPFKEEMAKGHDPAQFAKTLHESGRLKKPASGRGYQVLTPRLEHLGGIQQKAYLLIPLTAKEEE